MIFLSGLTQTKLRFRLLEEQITLIRDLGLSCSNFSIGAITYATESFDRLMTPIADAPTCF